MLRSLAIGLALWLAATSSGFAQSEAATPSVTVRDVSFQGAQHIPKPELDEFAYSLETTVPRTIDWAHGLSEKVRDFWQQHGYFRAEVKAAVRELPGSTAGASTCDVTFSIVEGAQYRLGRIAFRPATQVFAAPDLRAFIPLADGDVINSAKVLGGFAAIEAAYAQRGYARFTLTPEARFDDEKHLVYLNMTVFEGNVYHVGKISLSGPDRSLVESLRSRFPLRSGDVFDSALLDTFYRDNDELLPGKCAECTITSFDDKNGTVDIAIDLSRAPAKERGSTSGEN